MIHNIMMEPLNVYEDTLGAMAVKSFLNIECISWSSH